MAKEQDSLWKPTLTLGKGPSALLQTGNVHSVSFSTISVIPPSPDPLRLAAQSRIAKLMPSFVVLLLQLLLLKEARGQIAMDFNSGSIITWFWSKTEAPAATVDLTPTGQKIFFYGNVDWSPASNGINNVCGHSREVVSTQACSNPGSQNNYVRWIMVSTGSHVVHGTFPWYPYRYLVQYQTSSPFRFTISPVDSMPPSSTTCAGTNDRYTGLNMTGSTLLYFACSSPTRLARADSASWGSATLACSAAPAGASSGTIKDFGHINSDYIYAFLDYSLVLFVRSSLNEMMTWSWANTGTSFPRFVYSIVLDEARMNYHVSTGSNYLARVEAMHMQFGVAPPVIMDKQVNYVYDSLRNVPHYNLLLGNNLGARLMHVFSKLDYSIRASLTSPFSYLYWGISKGFERELQVGKNIDRHYFHVARICDNGSCGMYDQVVNAVYLDITVCTSRDANYYCTGCPTDNTVFLRDLRSLTCTPIEDMPQGFGLNRTAGNPGLIDKCVDPNCKVCAFDIFACQQCTAGFYYYNQSCYQNETLFPSGVGKDTTFTANWNALRRCTDAQCVTCTTSAAQCKACKTGFGAKADFSGCFNLTNIADGGGGGLNPDTSFTAPCADPNCLRCRFDINICEGCKLTPIKYILWNSSCRTDYDLPTGYGCVSGSPFFTYARCSDARCANCSVDATKCVRCETDLRNQTYLNGFACVYPETFPAGSGAYDLTPTMVACQDSRCQDCIYDYRVCRKCNPAHAYYLYGGACIVQASIPAGFGINSGPWEVWPCSRPYCLLCTANYDFCDKCDSSLVPPRVAYGGSCLTANTLPASIGTVVGQGTVAACADTNCNFCREDRTVCTQCKSGLSPTRYLSGGACVVPSAILDGFGARSTLEAVPCQNTHCLKCQSSYTSCTQCRVEVPQYFLDTATSDCVLPSVIADQKGANLVSLQVQACNNAFCEKCQQSYLVCTKCQATSTKYLHSGDCLSPGSLPNTFGAAPNNLALPCNDTRCLMCQNNYSVCTKCQNAPTMYYFHAPNASCLLANEMPVSYGASTSAGFGYSQPCTVPGCYACQTDYTVCGSCAPNSPKYWIYNLVCTLQPSLPNGFGGNNATNQAVPCADANCRDCRANFSNCTACQTQVPPRYLFAGNGTCLLPASLPAGFGADATTGLATPCATTNCSNCRTNFTTCVSCNTSGPYPSYLVSNTCYLDYLLPLTFGANNVTYQGTACSLSRCLNCSTNFSNCFQCRFQSPDLFLHALASGNQCYMTTEIPAGFGGDLASLITRPCLDSNCALCANDFRVCTLCNAAAVPIVYLHDGACRRAEDLPNPFGANNATRVASKCQDPNCIQCKLNFAFCELCSPAGPETYLHPVQGTCFEKDSVPDGWGLNKQNYQLAVCADPLCKLCKANYLECTLCVKTSEQFYVYQAKCIGVGQFPFSVGCNNDTLQAVPCSSPGCKLCTYNFLECVQCVDPPAKPTLNNPKYYLIEKFCDPCQTLPLQVIDTVCNRLCEKSSCLISLKKVSYMKSKKELRAFFSQKVFLNATASISLKIDAPESNINRELDTTEYTIQILNDVMLITLNVRDPEVRGSVVLDRVDKEQNPIRGDNRVAFFDYPIRWEGLYLLSSTAQKSLSGVSKTSMTTTSSARAIAQLIVITRSSNIAKIPDMMVANMIYLKMMNGETYLYPSIVYDFFDSSGLPFLEFENPFLYMKDASCLVSPKMYEANLDCNILVNYGVDVIFLYGTMAINIVLSIVHFGLYGAKLRLYKKHKDEASAKKMEASLGFKVSSFVNESYGAKMTLIKLDGTVVEVLFHSCLTLSSQGITSVSYLAGYLVAVSFVAYYVWSLYFYVRLVVLIAPGLDKIRTIEEERRAVRPAVYRPKQLEEYIDFTRVKYGMVGYQIADYRADLPFIFMFAPLVWFLRCVAINVFLIGGTNMKSGQYYAYLMIEGAYLYYLVKSKVKASRFENWLSYFNEGSQIVYLLAQVISYHSSDTDFKQKQVGFAQAGILVSVMVMNIGYTFLIFGWTCLVQPLVRLCRRKKVARPDRIPAEQLQAAAKEGEAAAKKKEEKKVVISTFRALMKMNAGKKLVDQSKHDLGSVDSPQLLNKELSANQKLIDGHDLKVDRRASIVSKGSKNNRFRLKKKPPGVPLEGSLLGFKPLAPTASAGDIRS